MGRTKNSGLGIGTGSSPQGNITQNNVDSKIEEIISNLKPFDSSKMNYEVSKVKYETYLLNEGHIIGGPKAKFLRETLGYGKNDGEKLHIAVSEAIHNKLPNKVEYNQYGIKYNFDVKLKGNNGKYYYANVAVVIQKDHGEKTEWRVITIIPKQKNR